VCDTLIISLSPLGSAAVACTASFELTELQQIPLRSFVATAKMSKASLLNQIDEVKFILHLFRGLDLSFVGISLVTFILQSFL
jgi:hypothetical protein